MVSDSKSQYKRSNDLTETPNDKKVTIVAFLCNWCSYAGADLAGVSRFQYPAEVRVIRVPCSGRVDPLYIIKALQDGADGVLVSGCHPGDCHYISGNLVARRKFSMLKTFLEYVGIEPQRVQFSWVSASEGGRFASLIEKVVNDVKALETEKKIYKEKYVNVGV
jgi:F420-non-reducing hydrogenase iron-sulfur subunit